MRPRTIASAALLLALLASTAAGQPPKDVPQPTPTKKADLKPADPTDAVIAAAQINDPGVRTAQAKLQLAEAELAQARYAAAVRVAQLKGKLESARATIQFEVRRYELAVKLRQDGRGLEAEISVEEARERLEKAKAELGALEAEWKLLTVGTGFKVGAALDPSEEAARERAKVVLAHLAAQDNKAMVADYLKLIRDRDAAREANVKGPIPDRLRATLDKAVRLGQKGEVVEFTKAVDIINKETGLGISVRGTYAVPPITSQGEELPVGAWFQMFQDLSGGAFYVREYGLLVIDPRVAPPDAPTLTQFWKQKPAGAPVPKPVTGAPK